MLEQVFDVGSGNRPSNAHVRHARTIRVHGRRRSNHKRNQRRDAFGIARVGLAELPAHDGLLDRELAPVRRAREDDGEQAAPLPDRQRGSSQGDENAGVDRVADP